MVMAILTLPSQTPPGLLDLKSLEIPALKSRDWARLGVSNYELRVLDRFYRDSSGIEGYHIAYESLGLNIAGILVQPHIELPDEDASVSIATEEMKRDEDPIMYPMVVLSHGSIYGLTQAYREIAFEFARRGYVVLASSYRGRGGREGRSQGHPQLARGEVLDLLQLVQIGRQIEYIDSQRLAILGFEDGATTALLGIQRSNVFKIAILVSPDVFSGMAEYSYTGRKILRKRSEEIFGRKLSENELIRELYYREGFRDSGRMTTPMFLLSTGSDVGRHALRYFVTDLRRKGKTPQFLEYPTMFTGFLTAQTDETRPETWEKVRAEAWGQIFDSIDEYLALPEELPGGDPRQH